MAGIIASRRTEIDVYGCRPLGVEQESGICLTVPEPYDRDPETYGIPLTVAEARSLGNALLAAAMRQERQDGARTR